MQIRAIAAAANGVLGLAVAAGLSPWYALKTAAPIWMSRFGFRIIGWPSDRFRACHQ